MPTSGGDARRRSLENRRLPCSVNGCTRRRKMVSAYCPTHGRHVALFGHHAGRYIRKQEYASYVNLARRLFRRLDASGHPALGAALSVVAALTLLGEQPRAPKPLRLNPRWLLWRELQRLEDVEPKVALAAVVGTYLYSYHQPRQLPDDQRLTYALAHAVFRLRPLAITRSYYNHETGTVENTHRPPSGLACGLLGSRLRNALAPFFVSLTEYVEQEHQRSAEQAMALRTPLTTP